MNYTKKIKFQSQFLIHTLVLRLKITHNIPNPNCEIDINSTQIDRIYIADVVKKGLYDKIC